MPARLALASVAVPVPSVTAEPALVPFTVNGLAVRESFFVSFLGALGVSADQAFSTGFLFFLVTIALAAPGVAILLLESVRRR